MGAGPPGGPASHREQHPRPVGRPNYPFRTYEELIEAFVDGGAHPDCVMSGDRPEGIAMTVLRFRR